MALTVRSIIPVTSYTKVFSSDLTVNPSSSQTISIESIPKTEYSKYFIKITPNASSISFTSYEGISNDYDLNYFIFETYDSVSGLITVKAKAINNSANTISFTLDVTKIKLF